MDRPGLLAHTVILVAQSVMSATDMPGHRDVCGLSATDLCPSQWICVGTKPKGCWNAVITGVGNPNVSVRGDKT